MRNEGRLGQDEKWECEHEWEDDRQGGFLLLWSKKLRMIVQLHKHSENRMALCG